MMDSLIAKKDLLCIEGISCFSFNKDYTSNNKIINKK